MVDEKELEAKEMTALVEERVPEGAGEAETGEGEEGAEEKKKLNQTVDISDVGPCRKHIKVSVDRSDIDELFSEKYKELVSDSAVPGFRPGKAPRQVVMRKFKKDVSEQVRAQVLLASLEQLADDFDVAPLAPPDINPNKLEIPDQGPFVYEFEVEVRPQFDLPDYKGLKLKRPVRAFSDADVEQEERRILSRYGSLVPKTSGAAQLGDYVTVDMTTRFGDKPIGTMKETTLRVDDTVTFKDAIAREFAKEVVGIKAGETRTVNLVMTEAVAQQALRGLTVQADMKVHELKTLRLPELTPDFLDGAFGVRTAEQLREQVRLLLERRLEYQQRQSAREQVLSHIAASATWDLPRDMLMRQARKSLARRVMEMQEAGLSEEEINARSRLLQQDVLRSTELALKEHFVLQKIAEVEKIEVDDEEIDAEVDRLADQTNDSARRVRARLEKEDLLETMAAQLIERKALDLILSSAEYEETQLEPEGGMAAVEQQTVEGELHDPTQAPPEEKKADEETNA
ncbi:MAG: trigger factor [Gemmataceae bacterium]